MGFLRQFVKDNSVKMTKGGKKFFSGPSSQPSGGAGRGRGRGFFNRMILNFFNAVL